MLNKKTRTIGLSATVCVLLLAAVCMTIFLFVRKGDDLMEPPVLKDEEYYYDELAFEVDRTSGRYGTALMQYDSEWVKVKYENEQASLCSLSSGETVQTIPKVVLDNVVNFTVDGKNGFITICYDEARDEVFSQTFDFDGKLQETVVLQSFAHKGETIEIRQFMVDEKYLYIQSFPKGVKYLQVFRRDGTLIDNYENTTISEKGINGTIYLAYSMDRGSYGIKKIDLEKKAVIYDVPIFKRVCGVRLRGANDTLYVGTRDGISIYDEKTGRFIKDAIEFGTDSSYIVENLTDISDYAITDDGEIYINRCNLKVQPRESFLYKYTQINGARPAREVKLTITAPYRNQAVYNAVKMYERQNPTEKINYDYDFESVVQFMEDRETNIAHMTTRILAGDIGDIVLTGGGGQNYFDMFKTDIFMDLKSLISADASYSALNKAVLKGIEIDGTARGLATFFSPMYIEVNTTLAEELGLNLDYDKITWNDVLDIVEVLEDEKSEHHLFSTTETKGSRSALTYMLIANMPDLIDVDKKTIDLCQPWFLDLLEKWKQCEKSDNFILCDTPYERDNRLQGALFTIPEVFEQELLADTMNWYNSFYSKTGEEHMYIPLFSGEKNSNRVAYTNSMYSISNKSANKEAAWKFLSLLLSQEIQTSRRASGFPINNEAFQSMIDAVINDSGKNVVEGNRKLGKELLNINKQIDKLYDMGLLKRDLYLPLLKYLNDAVTLDEALKTAEHDIWIRLNE